MSKSFNPTTTRLCRRCKDFRRFHYNKDLGHAQCCRCKTRWGLKASSLIEILQSYGFDLNKVKQDEELINVRKKPQPHFEFKTTIERVDAIKLRKRLDKEIREDEQ